ncbi:hypothetical protein PCYB_006540 [Plasmodium cynomolgi strain B]|uniref:Uncharacterized protein n=1 Tax=Plasmodium cynomolgi (strain B) TaxID=1120755 RepID=K6V3G1_PLACD|nr:hypothetical protein PCYB_006540 [Plasmodium cynomolgi strain B]GAB69905.1 hypothetical protein PCYB_006540 [Plasmodium cynomolgi strain B]
MQEKTNNLLILSTKLFAFFLILCAWNYPFQSSFFRNSSSKSNLNNILGELRGRLLKGGTAVERHAQDAVLRERLVNILHDDDETIKVRLNELIQEEKRKKTWNLYYVMEICQMNYREVANREKEPVHRNAKENLKERKI